MPELIDDLMNRLTPRSASVFEMAREELKLSKQDELTAEHVMLGLLREQGPAAKVLEEQGISEDEARSFVAEALWDEEPDYSQLRFSREMMQIMDASITEVEARGGRSLEPEHLLLGITLAGHDSASRLLYALGADRAALKQGIVDELDEAAAA